MAPKPKPGAQSVLITGCSNGGIGSALASCFATYPHLHVYATARSVGKMSDLASLPNVTLLELDVTSPSSISAAVERVKADGGRLEILVNNAGFGYTMPYLDNDVEICKDMFEVNVWGPVRVTQAFISLLVEIQGTVVMIGSTAEMTGIPYQSAYCGSKAALHLMSESLQAEIAPLGVKLLHVSTSFVATSWFSNVPSFELPSGSYYQPVKKWVEKTAGGQGDFNVAMPAKVYAERVVKDVLAGKVGRTYRGKSASLIRWALALLPRWLLDRIWASQTGLNILRDQHLNLKQS